MALQVGELFAELRLDDRGFREGLAEGKAGLQGVDGAAIKSESSLKKLGTTFSGVAKIAAGFVIAQGLLKLPGVLGGVVSAASDMGESLNKTRVVFGAASKEVEAFAKTSSASLGQSKQATLEATATFGNLFTTMGIGKQASAQLSIDIVKLSSDLASFQNLDPAQVLEDLQSGLVGETEPLRKYGILVNEATIKTKAMEMGIGDASGELTEAQKVQARYALIMEQTANAQGDFARTSDGLANSERRIRAAFADLSSVIGSHLLPAIEPLVANFADWLPNAVSATDAALTALGKTFSAFKGWITSVVTDGDALNDFLTELPGWFRTAVVTIERSLRDGGLNAIRSYAQGIVDGAQTYITQAVTYVSDLIASYLIGHSPPEQGPLSTIDEGGRAAMQAYVGGMQEGAAGSIAVAQTVADNLEAVGDGAGDAAARVDDLTGAIQDLGDQQDDIKNQIEDIEQAYEDQIRPLEDQLDALKNIVDVQREQEELAISLEQLEIKRAITAAKGDPVERARLEAQLEAIQQQQDENRLTEQAAKLKEEAATAGLREQQEQLQFRKEEIRIAERQRQLLEDAAEGKDVSADLAELDIQRQQLAIKKQLAESKSGRDATASKERDLELQQQENDLKQQLNGLTDKGAIAELEQRKGVLDARKDEIDATKEQEELERKLLALPIEEQIRQLKAEQEGVIDPLRRQQEMLSRRQELLEREKRQWAEIKAAIDEASGGKAKGGKKTSGGLDVPEVGGPAAAPADLEIPPLPSDALAGDEEAAKTPGEQFGVNFAQGFIDGVGAFIKDHLGGAIGSGLGGLIGTAIPIPGAGIVGALIGGLIGQGIQDELGRRGIDLSPLLGKIGDFGTGIFAAIAGPVGRVVNDIFPILSARFREILPELVQTKDRLLEAFGQMAAFIGRHKDTIVPIIESAWRIISDIIDGASKIITGIVRFILNVIQLDWKGAWDSIKEILDGAWQIITSLFRENLREISAKWSTAWDEVKDYAEGIWEEIKANLWAAWVWLKTKADQTWGDIKAAVTGPIDAAKAWLDTTWDSIKTKADQTWTNIRTTIENGKQGLIDALKAPFEWIRDNVGGMMASAANTVISKLNTAGYGIGEFVAGAGKALNSIFTALGLGAKFGESNPWKDIPGLATGGEVIGGGLTKVGEKGTELLWLPPGAKVIPHDPTEKILAGVDSGPMHAVGGPIDVGKNILSGVKSVASGAFDTITDWMKKGANWVVSQAFDSFGVGLDLPGVMGSLGSSIFGKVKDAATSLVKTLLDGLAMGGDWIKPLASYIVTQEYGPASGANGYSFHTGIDMAAPAGAAVRAAKGGRVASAGWNDGYGQAIILEHANNLRTLYGHLRSIMVNIGDMVRSGQTIGAEGSTGNSTGPHLHFETMQNGARVNPRTFIPALANGAVLNSPTLALLAETARAQPEIVTPERLMRQIVREELGALLGSGGAGQPIQVMVQSILDGRVVGESVAPVVIDRMGREYMRKAPR